MINQNSPPNLLINVIQKIYNSFNSVISNRIMRLDFYFSLLFLCSIYIIIFITSSLTPFVMHWKCLSLSVYAQFVSTNVSIKFYFSYKLKLLVQLFSFWRLKNSDAALMYPKLSNIFPVIQTMQ